MTPKTLWDADGFLYEVSPEDAEQVRVIWTPDHGWETNVGRYQRLMPLKQYFGPFLATA